MAKLSKQQNTGHRGEAFVEKVVSDAGHIWNARLRDFGIDGQIDFVNADGQVTGSHVYVQVKGTEHASMTQDGRISFMPSKDHVDHWMRCDRPVVLVVVDVQQDRAWFKRVDDWYRDSTRRSSRAVVFDTETERFDRDSVHRLVTAALPAGQMIPRLGGGETLESNLLQVTSFAPFLYTARTPCRRADAWERMRANNAFESGFHIAHGKIHSLRPIDASPLAVLCDGPVTADPTSEWAHSADPDQRRVFVALLNYTLRAMHHPRLVWHHKKHVVYFQAPPAMRRVRVKGNRPRSRGTSFFTPYFATDDATKVRFCRHHAADLRFREWDGTWYLEINPTYHFTIDGRRDSLYDEDYVSRIKRLERNQAVLRLVRAWADLLSGGEDDLFAEADRRIEFGELLTVEADVSILEDLWFESPAHTATETDAHLVAGLWDAQ